MDDDGDDEFFDDGLATLEERRRMERIRADGARVEVDMAEDTSLRRYVDARRKAAILALEEIVSVDPASALRVAELQHSVAEYLNVRAWVRGEIEKSVRADEIIQRDFRGESTDIDDAG